MLARDKFNCCPVTSSKCPEFQKLPKLQNPKYLYPNLVHYMHLLFLNDAVKPIPVNITSGAGSTVPSAIVKFGNGLSDKKTSVAENINGVPKF
jgi:hypothetical protein